VKVSVIATVLNEGPAIERLLESLAAQSRPPDEVVIADGGSTDGTIDILNAWAESGRLPLQVVSAPGTNISAGRNAAIAAAGGDLIASTDAGVLLDIDWLAALLAPFGMDAADAPTDAESPAGDPADTLPGKAFVAVVSGWFTADPQTAFETAMGATVLPHLREIKPASFLPSSRSVAFRRVAWEAVGGYPEWLDYGEDLVFDLRLKGLYGSFPFVPEAVAHFRPRRNLRAFSKQYYCYARGDGKADLWRRRHAIRYVTYLLFTPGLLILAALHSPWWLLAFLAGAALYTATPYRRLWPMLESYGLLDQLKAVVWVPIIRIVGDVAKMIGYPVGLAWRWQNRRQPEIHWRREVWVR
jgi:glycosyltransferase involved in cell wall biosynthesis